MGLFSRISDIISANLNEMIEQFEDPETMLKQAVREMHTSIDQVRQSTAHAVAEQKLLVKELEKNQREAAMWAERAETAVADDNDDLARRALGRKQEHASIAAALEDQLTVTRQTTDSMRRQLDAMQAKLAEAKRRLGTLAARKRAADLRARAAAGPTHAAMSTDAFAKFDRMREKVDLAEAQAEAMRELTHDAHADIAPPDMPSPGGANAEVEAELEELKKKAST